MIEDFKTDRPVVEKTGGEPVIPMCDKLSHISSICDKTVAELRSICTFIDSGNTLNTPEPPKVNDLVTHMDYVLYCAQVMSAQVKAISYYLGSDNGPKAGCE